MIVRTLHVAPKLAVICICKSKSCGYLKNNGGQRRSLLVRFKSGTLDVQLGKAKQDVHQ